MLQPVIEHSQDLFGLERRDAAICDKPLDVHLLDGDHRRVGVPPPTFLDWSLNRAALDSSASTEHPRAVIEGALAHVVRNQTEAASVRSDLFERRRRLGACAV